MLNRWTVGMIILSGFASALLTLSVYHFTFSKSRLPTKDDWQAQQVGFQRLDNLLHSGRLQHQFLSASPTDFVTASKISTPSVVYIESEQDVHFGGWSNFEQAESSGSGVIISPDGYIVTNHHVIENSKHIRVLLNDNREYNAKLIGTDPTTDIALIKIEEKELPYILFGNSDSLQVGEWVLAVGNPFKLQSTVTVGIVSAKGRNINILNEKQYSIESFIQTDAAVNPGNSGGALVNTVGELVGINTAIVTKSGRYEGYSFSIPVNLVQKVIMDIKEFGMVQRGLLGVVIQSVDNTIANNLGLEKIAGVLITYVNPQGAAHNAGLKEQDVIVEVNGLKVNTMPELQEIIGRFRPGDKITLQYVRNQKVFSQEIILKNQINSTELIATRKDKILIELGFELRDLSANEKSNLQIQGVKVLSIYRGSTIERTNMSPDYIITKVNNTTIQSVDQLVQILESTKGKIVIEGVYERYKGIYPYSFIMK